MIAGALAALLALAPGGIEVTGDATCPTPAEVAARLVALVPTETRGRADAAAAKVIVARTERTMRLELLGPNANELATRELPAEGSCDDLAAAAAVVVAAWSADLNPDLTPSVTLQRQTPVTSSAAVPPNAIGRAAPPATSNPRPYALGLGLLGSETGGDVAPGAILLGSLAFGARGLALDASVSGTTSRSAAVGALPTAASWTRATLAVGPALGLGHASVRGDVHLQGLAAVLRVRGVDVPNAASDTTTELGIGAGARLDVVTGTSAVWLGLDALTWPGDQRLLVANTSDVGQLPRLELVACLGISLGQFQ